MRKDENRYAKIRKDAMRKDEKTPCEKTKRRHAKTKRRHAKTKRRQKRYAKRRKDEKKKKQKKNAMRKDERFYTHPNTYV